MTSDETTFESLAEAMLQSIFERVEAAVGDEVEVELEGGVLTIEVEDRGTFLLNKHAPLRQLWLSSPVSGASHYAYEAEHGRWRSTRDGADLVERLAADLATATGGAFSWD